jgi:predicted GIY-YIG superfamily endonuclease
MTYVYILESTHDRTKNYIGCTGDFKRRYHEHNAGRSPHTAKFRPWIIVSHHAFADRRKAFAFEAYLKSGSGRAFLRRHL